MPPLPPLSVTSAPCGCRIVTWGPAVVVDGAAVAAAVEDGTAPAVGAVAGGAGGGGGGGGSGGAGAQSCGRRICDCIVSSLVARPAMAASRPRCCCSWGCRGRFWCWVAAAAAAGDDACRLAPWWTSGCGGWRRGCEGAGAGLGLGRRARTTWRSQGRAWLRCSFTSPRLVVLRPLGGLEGVLVACCCCGCCCGCCGGGCTAAAAGMADGVVEKKGMGMPTFQLPLSPLVGCCGKGDVGFGRPRGFGRFERAATRLPLSAPLDDALTPIKGT